jgi:rhodanese-related sulfurtransferase
MDASVSTAELRYCLQSDRPPLVIDVRKPDAFRAAREMIAGALRRAPEDVTRWAPSLPQASAVVVYCVHGHEVSQGVCHTLNARGIATRYLEGGIAAWRAADGALHSKPAAAPTRWVTRERPKIDRIACPWLIRRFVDPDAEFLYVPAANVRRVAAEREAVPYDIPAVEFSHVGEHCSFDAFLKAYRLTDPALVALAPIVRGADTDCHALAPQAAGLAALSLGLSRLTPDDHAMLEQGMVIYDALYLWCKEGKSEVHTWNPNAYR